jgi:hypothetical protein
MRHPTDGTLRRLVDEPAGVAEADREHVAGCPPCLSALAASERDAAVIGAAIGSVIGTAMEMESTVDTGVDAGVDVDAGWRRLSGALAEEGRGRTVLTRPASRWRTALRSPTVAVVGVVALVTGAAAAAAADWLPIFRTEQIAPVTAPRAELVKLPDLSDFGPVEVVEEVDVREAADADAAEEASGLSVPRVSERPPGVTGDPAYHVLGRVSGTFTFSTERAGRTAEAAGEALPPPPPGLDGSRFRFVAGPGVIATWAEDRPFPAMIVARAVAPAAYSTGVPFETARDYLLSLPMLPEEVAAQLRGFSTGGTTLPLFVSVEKTSSSTARVAGAPATVLATRDGTMSAVVWVDDGIVTAVAGSLRTDEVLAVARGLRGAR